MRAAFSEPVRHFAVMGWRSISSYFHATCRLNSLRFPLKFKSPFGGAKRMYRADARNPVKEIAKGNHHEHVSPRLHHQADLFLGA